MNKPPLYDTVDRLYNSAAKNMPKKAQQHPGALAAAFGFIGAYALVRGLQYASKQVVDQVIPGFDEKLPTLETVCATTLVVGTIGWALKNPKQTEEVQKKHPVYTTGMIAAVTGAITAVVQDINKRQNYKLGS